MTGVEYVVEMRDRGTNYPAIGAFVGFTIHDVERGKITISGTPRAEHYNPFGVVHGGFASTLLDLALGHVSVTALASAEEAVTTTDLSVKYVRPMFESTGTVFCDATVLHQGKRIVVAEARLRDADGRLLALAQSTCLVIARSPS